MSVFGVILVPIFPQSEYCDKEVSPNSIQMQENTDQNNCKYEHFLGSVLLEAKSVIPGI